MTITNRPKIKHSMTNSTSNMKKSLQTLTTLKLDTWHLRQSAKQIGEDTDYFIQLNLLINAAVPALFASEPLS